MKPLDRLELTAEQIEAVATLYRTTHNVRLRTRAQMVLLAAEQQLGVREIAAIVRECQNTVRCWLKRYAAHGIEGLPSMSVAILSCGSASGVRKVGWRRSSRTNGSNVTAKRSLAPRLPT
jgi:transposase-like protein